MDALSDVLRLVRLTGAVFFSAELSAPWAVQSPPSAVLRELLMPEAEHLIEYHLLVEGRCCIEVEGEPPLEVSEGDLVMVPRGDAHRMYSSPGRFDLAIAAPAVELPVDGRLATQRFGGGGPVTRLVCGYLAIDRRLCGPLVDALPRLFRIEGAAGSELDAWLRAYLRLRLADRGRHRPGSACVLSRLSELMFVEAVRRYVETLPPGQSGWLAGLQDPHVGRALGLLHGQPTRAWTLEALAREVGASRSVLAERFAALLGRGPMQYLTQWRLNLAAHRLSTTAKPASTIGFEVGYESEAAFSRAFRREFGAPPAAWRRARSAGASMATAA